MSNVWNGFEANPFAPDLSSRVYSGECRYLSSSYSSEVTHYSVLMFDQLNGKPYFSTIFGFFLPENEWAGWTLEDGRRGMHEDWKEYGVIQNSVDHAVVVVDDEDGAPAIRYWMRQNQVTKEIYYFTQWQGAMAAYCLMKPHF